MSEGLSGRDAGVLDFHGLGDPVEAAAHPAFREESLDDAEAAEGFLDLAHGVAPHGLGLERLFLELSSYLAHDP